jgi:hypothetical protein
MHHFVQVLLVGGLVSTPSYLSGQAVVLDEGAFFVEVGGRRIGTETFRIRRMGFGDNTQVIAQGSLDLVEAGESRVIESALGAVGMGMSLDAYQVKVASRSELQVRLQRQGDRLIAETTSDAGKEEREYRRLSSQTPTVLLDRFFAHHYFFIAQHQRPGETRISIIRPRPGGQVTATLRMLGVQPIEFGAAPIQSQHLELVLEGERHEIWLDNQNRVLRVEIPSLEYAAIRREAPR